MTCKEAKALISAAVDGELDDKAMVEFLSAISQCEECRKEYETELHTKNLLRQRLKKVKAPQSLVDAITRQTIGKDDASPMQFSSQVVSQISVLSHQPDILSRLKRSVLESLYINPNLNSKTHPIFAVSLGICVLAMLVFAGFMRHREGALIDEVASTQPSTLAQSNIFDLTQRIFQESSVADIESQDATVISNHIAEKIGSSIVVPTVREFHIHSARLTALGSANATEVRFQHNRNAKMELAVYIAKESDVLKSATLSPEVVSYISENGKNFYQKSCPSGTSVVIWKWGEMIYTATANTDRINLAQAISNPYWEN